MKGARGRNGSSAGALSAKILTFLIADVRGYTRFTQEHGDEASARLATKFAEIAQEGVESRGGSVIELRGDEALAVFDSARQALRAAVELQATFADETELDQGLPLRVGIGLDAGEAVPVGEGYRGGALNLAARLCSQAGPFEVLASQGVVHLARAVEGIRFEERGQLELKGLEEPVTVLRVVPDPAEETAAPRSQSLAVGAASTLAMVPGGGPREIPRELDATSSIFAGRDRDLRWLRWNWRQARRGAGRFLLVLGPVGMGKTRLASELAVGVQADGGWVRYASARADPGDLPIALAAAQVEDGPGLLVLDDLDAAPRNALNDLARLAPEAAGRPLLIVGTAEDADGRLDTLQRPLDPDMRRTLEPLDADAVQRIAGEYAGEADIGLPVGEILRESGGMPLAALRAIAAWTSREASRRLGDAASRAAVGRTDLRALEAEVADNVMDLQFMRERARLVGTIGEVWATREGAGPFKGLVSFDVEDADVFAGRERLVAEMVARLAGSTLLGVVGPSGSGKSSAVRAGLVPALEAGVLPGTSSWLRAIVRPGAYPLRELDRAVWAAFPEAIRSQLAGTDLPLRGVRGALREGQRVLLIVDQFEELFTACQDEDDRAAFVRALTEAAQDPGRSALVVIAIRADFYGRCAAYSELAGLLGANHVLVGQMAAEEYRRAIEQPARLAGLRIDAALVDALVNEVEGEPGALPLLSTALLELWQRREDHTIRMAAYLETGGVRGAVARLAETAYASLTEEQRAVARGVMLRLAGLGGAEEAVRRRVPLSEFDADRSEDVARVLAVLTDSRLLTVSEGTVEVAHEALLREWPRLRQWMEEDREGRRLHQHMIGAAKEWTTAGRDPGELYRGARLASALDWTTEHNLELNELERQFLGESRSASEREIVQQRATNRRLRGLLAGVAVFLVVALVAGGLAIAQRGKARRAARVAQRAATAADAQRLGAQALVQTDLDLTLLLTKEGVNLDDSDVTEGNLLAALVRSPAAIGVLRPLPGRLLDAGMSPDGRTLFVANNAGQVALIDTAAKKVLRTFKADFTGFNADGTLKLFRGTPDGTPIVSVMDVRTGAETRGPTIPAGTLTAGIAPDRATVAFVGADGVIRVSNEPTGVRLAEIPPRRGISPFDITFTADSEYFVTFDAHGNPANPSSFSNTLWRVADAKPLLTFPDAPWAVSPDDRLVATGGNDGSVHIYEVATGERRELNGRHNGGAEGVGFSPDGMTLASTGGDQLVLVWDVASGQLLETLAGHNGRVKTPAFGPDGKTLYTVSLDGSVIVWDLSGERRLGRPFTAGAGIAQPGDVGSSFALSPDGHLLAANQADGSVVIHDGKSLDVVKTIVAVSSGSANDVAFSPDGRTLAVAGDGGEVSLWDAETWTRHGTPLAGIPAASGGGPNRALSVAFSPNGRTVVAGALDGKVYLWDAQTGGPLAAPIQTGGESVLDVAFSPDGSKLAAAFQVFDKESPIGVGGWATVWNAGDRSKLFTVNVDNDYGHADAVTFSRDGRLFVTGGGTGDVRFFDARTGKRQGRTVFASAGWVLSMGFDAGGKRLVTGGSDGSVRLINVGSRQQVGSALPGLANTAVWATYTLNGLSVIAVFDAGRGYIWDVVPKDWQEHACTVAGRNLTRSEWQRFLPDRPYRRVCPSIP
jgi:WD40 repeat protein/class 3 adenylate cyclase